MPTVLAADRRGRHAGPAQLRRPAAIYAPDRLGPARLNMAIFTDEMIYFQRPRMYQTRRGKTRYVDLPERLKGASDERGVRRAVPEHEGRVPS
jgi:hypothetical protein